MLLPLLVLACHAPGPVGKRETADTSPPPPPPPALSAPAAFDPVGGSALELRVENAPGGARLAVLDEQGYLLRELELSAEGLAQWDGRDAEGDWATVGRYRVQLLGPPGGGDTGSAVLDEREVVLLRAAVRAAWAEGDGGTTALRVPLYSYRDGTLQAPSEPFAWLDAVDGPDGPAQFAEPSTRLEALAGEPNQPLAFRWDSRPLLTLELGESELLGGSGLGLAEVRLAIEGWEALSGADPLRPDRPAVFQRAEPLSDSLGVLDETLSLSFEVEGEDGLPVQLSHQSLPVRWYLTLDEPSFEEEGTLYSAWAAAVGPALTALQGTPPDAHAVLDALVAWIYGDLGLAYDTRYGASAYTDYRAGDWSRAHFLFSDFLERRMGSTVNCSDCASILLAYANCLGAYLQYEIVLQNFRLGYIQAIGTGEFTNCPFGPGGCSFSYHAVTTDDGAATIWDATLALDGDEDPDSPPSTFLQVQGIDGQEYLDRLVASGSARYAYPSQGTLQ